MHEPSHFFGTTPLKIRPKLAAAVMAGALCVALVGGAGWAYTHPIEYAETKSRWELRAGGVATTRLGGDWNALERNFCEPGVRNPECTCIALVHGLGDRAGTWKKILLRDRTDWPAPVHLLAPDLPGHGETAPAADASGYRARTLGNELLKRLRAVPEEECRAWMVVGNSFGGWIAAWAALEGSDRINKVMLVDGAGLAAPLKARMEGREKNLFDGTVEGLKEFQRRAYFKPRELPEAVWEAAAKRMREGASLDVMKSQTLEDALDTYLASMKPSAMFFWGAADRIIPPEQGRELARLVPGALFREAPECGHLPQKECPEALMKALGEFVKFGGM